MRVIIVTISLLIFLNSFLIAGEPVGFRFSEKSVYSFRYNSTNNLPLNNYFVKEIARFNYLNLYKTNYELEYEQSISLSKVNDSLVSVNCQIDPLQLKGDIYYERFNLSDVMMPSLCDFAISVYDDRHRKTATIEVTDCPVSQSPENTYGINGFIPEKNPVFEVSDVKFKYQPGNKNAFEQRISAINIYLACLEASKYSLNKTTDINPDTRENTLSAFLRIHDVQRLLMLLNRQNHDNLTAIPLEYSSAYTQNLDFLDSQARRLSTVFLQNMDTLTFHLSENDYLKASEQIIAIQKGYLGALSRTNYLYEPVFMELASFFSGKNGWSILMDEMKPIFENPDLTHDRLDANKFGTLLIKSYIRETDSLIKHENFTDAVLMLESAEAVCDAINDNECGLNVFHRLSLSKYGIYDSYISVARSSISYGNLNLAYKYLMMAREFQQSNSNLIITAGQVNADLEQLAWLFLEAGKGKDYNHLTEENLEYLDKAWDIYQLINVHDFDHIISRLLQKYNYE